MLDKRGTFRRPRRVIAATGSTASRPLAALYAPHGESVCVFDCHLELVVFRTERAEWRSTESSFDRRRHSLVRTFQQGYYFSVVDRGDGLVIGLDAYLRTGHGSSSHSAEQRGAN